MKVLSVNVGLPRKVIFYGQNVTTGIFKESIKGPVMVKKLNLDGDRQADLTVHGVWAKRCIHILKNIIITGVINFLISILCGECLVRTLPLND